MALAWWVLTDERRRRWPGSSAQATLASGVEPVGS
jgi:hypothetical protein